MKSIYLFSFLLLSCLSVQGQRTCGSELDLIKIQLNEPERYQRIQFLEQQINEYSKIYGIQSHGQLHITIPVVVHVLHNGVSVGSGLNISMAQIKSQIDVLNEDFRRLNSDKNQTPTVFSGVAADVGIEFALACVDPNGNSTTGVIRRQTNKLEFSQALNDIKFTNQGGSNAWPSNRYLNIWVGGRIETSSGKEILGYAQFPDQLVGSPATDGVVIRTTSFGRTGNVSAPFHKGRTATHEVGHWLNLRHIWGDASCGNDFVADTPIQQQQNFGCPTHPKSSCGSNDMFMNYMDYTDDACMNIFTAGQATRMLALFASGGLRSSFVNCKYIADHCKTPSAISGAYLLCTSNKTFSIQNQPPNTTINWSVSPTDLFAVDNGTGNTFATRATNSSASGQGTITATLNGPCGTVTLPSKSVWVGKPKVVAPNGSSSVPLRANTQFGNSPFPCISYMTSPPYYVEISESDYSYIKGDSGLPTWSGLYSQLYVEGRHGRGAYFHPTSSKSGYIMASSCNECGCAPVATAGYGPCSGSYSTNSMYSIYPNPASSEVTLNFSDEGYENSFKDGYVIQVYNQFQKKVFEASSTKQLWDIDTKNFPKGIYIINIIHKEGTLQEQLIIE